MLVLNKYKYFKISTIRILNSLESIINHDSPWCENKMDFVYMYSCWCSFISVLARCIPYSSLLQFYCHNLFFFQFVTFWLNSNFSFFKFWFVDIFLNTKRNKLWKKTTKSLKVSWRSGCCVEFIQNENMLRDTWQLKAV